MVNIWLLGREVKTMKSLCVRLAFFNNECDCYITVNYGNDIVVLQRQRKGQRAYRNTYYSTHATENLLLRVVPLN